MTSSDAAQVYRLQYQRSFVQKLGGLSRYTHRRLVCVDALTTASPQPLVHSTMHLLFHWSWHGLTTPLPTAQLTAAAGGRVPCPLPADLDAPQCTPWTQVHALNTLKQVFQDKDLSAVTSGYVALGTVNVLDV